MALYRQRPIDELVSWLDLVLPGFGEASMAKSAVAKARARLGDEPLRWLFEKCARKWGHESARRHEWRGLALYGVDGSTVRVPDSFENRSFFGRQDAGAGRGVSGYPLARIVTMMALRSHILVAAKFGQRPYARELWPELPDNSLAIVGFAWRGPPERSAPEPQHARSTTPVIAQRIARSRATTCSMVLEPAASRAHTSRGSPCE